MSEKLKNAPVYFTIAQVQHNPLLSLESYIPAVQEKMRKAGYPDFKRAMSIQFDLGSASIGNESQIAQPTSQRIEKYIFANLKRSTAFVMQPQSVALETTDYETFEHFLGELKKGIEIVSEVIGGFSFVDRLGLRYLDAISPRKDESLDQYLQDELLGFPKAIRKRMTDAQFAHTFTESLLVQPDVGQVVARVIIRNGPLGFPPDLQPDLLNLLARFQAVDGEHAILDTDAFIVERAPYDSSALEQRFESLHKLLDVVFRASTTDHARKIWRDGGTP